MDFRDEIPNIVSKYSSTTYQISPLERTKISDAQQNCILDNPIAQSKTNSSNRDVGVCPSSSWCWWSERSANASSAGKPRSWSTSEYSAPNHRQTFQRGQQQHTSTTPKRSMTQWVLFKVQNCLKVYLLHLELDGGFNLFHFADHRLGVSQRGREFTSLVQAGAQKTWDLLDKSFTGEESVVLLG